MIEKAKTRIAEQLIIGPPRSGMSMYAQSGLLEQYVIEVGKTAMKDVVEIGVAGQQLLTTPKNQKWYHRFDKRRNP